VTSPGKSMAAVARNGAAGGMAMQAWPEKARRVGVGITNANINLNIKRRVD